jgi:hypothetical protein
MNYQKNREAASIAEEMKRKLTDAMNQQGTDRQLTRESCKQQITELADTISLTRDDHESLSSAIDKDENLAITLIDRYLENYLR